MPLLFARASALILLFALAYVRPATAQQGAPPNVVLIFADDLGYGDLGLYGAEGYRTPHLDRLGREGARFTDFYVAAPVCTPSRAALLTGSYPKRVGLAWRVLFPYSDTGLHPDEVTLAEVLKDAGYRTAAVGKWHLGHQPVFLPTRQGFDSYYGIPYSNDMGNNRYRDDFTSPPTPILRDEALAESDPDQRLLTKRYTEEALRFIDASKDGPFFLYLAHSMPHVPIAASEGFEGRSAHGLYGDVIEEMDWSVGQILARLEAHGIDDNTLVIFTSDNGPQVWEGEGGWVWRAGDDGRGTRGTVKYRSGSSGGLRGNKNTTWEGGMRVPALMRWPARIPAGTVTGELATTMDLLPTIARHAGARLPEGRVIDGKDISPLLFGEAGARTPHAAFFYYRDDRLQAVRSGRWKLHVYRPEWGEENYMSGPRPLLYDLLEDPGETTELAARHPDVVRQLQALAESARHELGDAVTGRDGTGVRPVGRLTAGSAAASSRME